MNFWKLSIITTALVLISNSANASLYALTENRTYTIDTGTGIANEFSLLGSGYNSGALAYSVVPIPGAVWLFGSGLIGLITVVRRKRNL